MITDETMIGEEGCAFVQTFHFSKKWNVSLRALPLHFKINSPFPLVFLNYFLTLGYVRSFNYCKHVGAWLTRYLNLQGFRNLEGFALDILIFQPFSISLGRAFGAFLSICFSRL